MIMLVAFPDRYVATTLSGLKIWAVTVLPSLLPFFFLTALFTKTETLGDLAKKANGLTRFLYNESGIAAYLQSMSFLSGYPIGAKLVADLYDGKVIDEKQATHLSVLSSTSGPLFIVGGIGVGMFRSPNTGYAILLSHYIASVLCGIIFRPHRNTVKGVISLPNTQKCDNVLYESIYSSVVSVAIVGGFIAVFFTFANVLADAKILSPLTFCLRPFWGEANAEGFAVGLVECTTGIKLIAENGSGPLEVGLAAALVSLGGLSVWCQSLVYLKKARVNGKIFFAAKIAQAAFSFAVCLLLCFIFKIR